MKNNKTGGISTLKASLEMSKQKIEFLTQMNDLDRSEIKMTLLFMLFNVIMLAYCVAMILLANNLKASVIFGPMAGLLAYFICSGLKRVLELRREIGIRMLKIENEVKNQDEILTIVYKIRLQMQAEAADE